MVKHGPCYHCGIEKTPLWRNGPPEKPVLCNACGSRWRIRGTLDDYIPKHALAVINNRSRDRTKNPNHHNLPLEIRPAAHINIMDHNRGHPNVKPSALKYIEDLYSNGFGDDASHRSSSAGSSSMSCSDHSHTEPPCSVIHCTNNWNSTVPSRKRSLIQQRNVTFVERLRKDLYEILQNEEFSTLCESPDGELIFYQNGDNPEIGLGAVLLKPTAASAKEEPKTYSSKAMMGSSSLKKPSE